MKKIVQIAKLLFLPVALFLVFTFASSGFGIHSLSVVLSQAMVPLVMGYAMCITMQVGLTDFSVGARIILAAMLGSVLEPYFGAAGMVIGCLIGGLIGGVIFAVLYRLLRIPSLVLSLGYMLVFEIIASYIGGADAMGKVSRGSTIIGSYPYNLLIAIVAAVLFYIILYRTKTGMNIMAVGNDEKLAADLGINSNKVKNKAILLSGLFCGIGGIIQICYSGIISASIGMSSMMMVFKPMMGVMIGMVLIHTINNLSALIFVGEIVITILFNGFIALGWDSTLQNIALGGFLVIIMGFTNSQPYIAEYKRRRKHNKEIIGLSQMDNK